MTMTNVKRYTIENYHHLDDLVQHITYEVTMKEKALSRNVSKLYNNAVKEKRKVRDAILSY